MLRDPGHSCWVLYQEESLVQQGEIYAMTEGKGKLIYADEAHYRQQYEQWGQFGSGGRVALVNKPVVQQVLGLGPRKVDALVSGWAEGKQGLPSAVIGGGTVSGKHVGGQRFFPWAAAESFKAQGQVPHRPAPVQVADDGEALFPPSMVMSSRPTGSRSRG